MSSTNSSEMFSDTPTVGIRAFNLVPGATFIRDECIWVATSKVTRDSEHEVVHVIVRAGILDDRGYPAYKPHSFTFDYCDPIRLVGICIHPNDENDNDWGNEAMPEVVANVEPIEARSVKRDDDDTVLMPALTLDGAHLI